MNHSNISESDWKKVKSEIQKTWSGLNGDALEKTHGDVRAISSLVQKKYGIKREEAERKLDEVIDRCGTAAGPSSVSSERSSRSSESSSRESRGGESRESRRGESEGRKSRR